ncbi:MAG: hypothetical protein IT463_06490 [Planctomycetes bacterium]|nr:hypothetical protein [Planctomycetota bacterium]
MARKTPRTNPYRMTRLNDVAHTLNMIDWDGNQPTELGERINAWRRWVAAMAMCGGDWSSGAGLSESPANP